MGFYQDIGLEPEDFSSGNYPRYIPGDIKAAFRAFVKRNHPDKQAQRNEVINNDLIVDAYAAYDVLKSEKRKLRYDRKGDELWKASLTQTSQASTQGTDEDSSEYEDEDDSNEEEGADDSNEEEGADGRSGKRPRRDSNGGGGGGGGGSPAADAVDGAGGWAAGITNATKRTEISTAGAFGKAGAAVKQHFRKAKELHKHKGAIVKAIVDGLNAEERADWEEKPSPKKRGVNRPASEQAHFNRRTAVQKKVAHYYAVLFWCAFHKLWGLLGKSRRVLSQHPQLPASVKWIYALECAPLLVGGAPTWYIGQSEKRQARHKTQLAKASLKKAKWAQLHPAKLQAPDLMRRAVGIPGLDEDKVTLEYMLAYGVENVRGGSFCSPTLLPGHLKTINRMLDHAADKCFECREVGHCAKQCPRRAEAVLALAAGPALGPPPAPLV